MNNPVAALITNDPRTNYYFCKEGDNLAPSNQIGEEHIDYLVPRDETAINKGHKQDLPLSFFKIKEGDVEAGKVWYQNKFPKLDDEFAHILARYQWGDLKYATKKSLKNSRKKSVKKTGKKEEMTKGMVISREPVILKF